MKQLLFFGILLISIPTDVLGQWQQLPGPGGSATTIVGSSVSGWMYAGTTGGVFQSTNKGSSWEPSGLSGDTVWNLFSFTPSSGGEVLFATISHNDGDSWSLFRSMNEGSTWDSSAEDVYVEKFFQIGDTMCFLTTGSDSNVFQSFDEGQTWSKKGISVPCLRNGFSVGNDFIGLNCNNNLWGFSFSQNSYVTLSEPTFSNTSTLSLYAYDSTIYLTDSGALWSSTDLGEHWNHIVISGSKYISQFAANGSDLVVISHDSISYYSTPIPSMEYYSTDNGNTWQGIPSPVPLGTQLQSVSGAFFYLADPLLRSTDGVEWNYAAEGLSSANITDLISYHGNLFAIASLNSINRSTDGGETWNIIPSFSPSHFTILPSGLYAYGQYQGGLQRWSDTGWVTLMAIGSPNSIFCVAEQGDTLFAATSLHEINGDSISQYEYSTDNGLTWNLGTSIPISLFDNVSGFAGMSATILSFYDNGTSLMAVDAVQDFIVIDTGQGHQESYVDHPLVLLSTDAGRTWSETYMLIPSMTGPVSFKNVDTTLFEAAPSGLWAMTYPYFGVEATQMLNDAVFLDTATNGVIVGGMDTSVAPVNLYFVAENGNVTKLLGGDTLVSIMSYTTDSTYAYIGTSGRGIWRTPLSNIPSSSVSVQQPFSNSLSIYPNPSTSQSTIAFSLPEHSYISLKLYDELGVLRSSIFDGEMDAGNHEISFADPNLPNGIYEVVLRTAINRSVARLVIVR